MKTGYIENVKRKVGIYPVLDRYVFREFMIPFTVLLLAFSILFIMGDIFSDLNELLEGKASVAVMVKYFTLKIPGNIRFILPISVLLACMYTMANFGRNREVTAMRASGISLIRSGGSIYFAAFIVTLVNFWFNEQLVPYTEREAFLTYRRVQYPDYDVELYSKLQYKSSDKTRIWFFNNFDVNGVQKDVILKQYRMDDANPKIQRLAWDLRAREAVFTPGVGWTFTDVIKTPYSKKFHIPGNPEKIETMKVSIDEIPEYPNEILNAIKEPDNLSSWTIFKILHSNKNMAESLHDVYSTIFYSRLAFPWACFLGVFLGIPLAGKNERSGIFLSIVVAVGAVVVYQVLTNIFLVLGKQGYVPPNSAGLAPTAAFITYGWLFVIRRSG